MSPASRAPRPRPPVGQSMALLTELMHNPLDGSYRDRAEARIARGEPAHTGSRSLLLMLSCAALGLLLVVAAQTLRVPQERASGQRAQLIEQIESGQRQNDRLRREARGLRAEISTLGSRTGNESTAARLRRTEVAAAAVSVSGPGVRITLDDREGAAKDSGGGPREAAPEQETLTSTDLQVVANGLWQNGAEAIGINGQRLTALSAIRFAGAAILVDYRPLARPYVITAVGPPDLWERFQASSGGAYLETTKARLPLDVQVASSQRLTLPASSTAALHSARAALAPTSSATEAP